LDRPEGPAEGQQSPPPARSEVHIHHHWHGVTAEDVAAIIERQAGQDWPQHEGSVGQPHRAALFRPSTGDCMPGVTWAGNPFVSASYL
jgi:hypothetical protein